jgi:hypothetical protein
MAIIEHGVVSVRELLAMDLRVPDYQRPFAWEPVTVRQLLDDLWEAHVASLEKDHAADGHGGYALGSVILYGEEAQGAKDIVDGQQRLISLSLLLSILDLGRLDSLELRLSSKEPNESTGMTALLLAYRDLRAAINSLVPKEDRERFAGFVRERCELVWVQTNDQDEAFRFFDSQNYRGKALDPHDLLKAHHLRAIHGESEASLVAIVETWEKANDKNELEHLFSRYLYRIARWSRGQDAEREFTTQDIGLFKGLDEKHRAPSALYHRAAQLSIPALSGWSVAAQLSQRHRALERSRFQLDAPIIAGKPFFDHVAFMLDEVNGLLRILHDPNEPWAAFVTPPRYRYVSELFIAAVLYHTNRFLDFDVTDPVFAVKDDIRFAEAWNRYFHWAYSLRLSLQRVQWRSVSNRAKEHLPGMMSDGGMFASIREWASEREIRLIPIIPAPEPEDRDKALVDYLKRGVL